jgi:hypothetical protein
MFEFRRALRFALALMGMLPIVNSRARPTLAPAVTLS